MAKGPRTQQGFISPGLGEVQKALAALNADANGAMQDALQGIAEGIASKARAKVPYRTGAARASYRAAGGAVTFGGPSAPYAPWLEFGGRVGKSTQSRRRVPGGRYLYPTIVENQDETDKAVIDALTEIVLRYGMDIEGR